MSKKETKALIHRFFEEFNKGKTAAMAIIDELYATDIIFHSSTGKDICGLKDYKQFCSEFFDAMPDANVTIDDIIVEGDKVATRWTLTGTHKGELRGKHVASDASPTYKKVTTWAITIDRIVGGKFVEEWERYDTLGLMQQLGLITKQRRSEDNLN